MADERDFELLDDYLSNRMTEEDRAAFEKKLDADPDLGHEYAIQEKVIQGIKDARIAELKSMLNQVPVPSANTGSPLASKIAIGTAVTLMIVAAAYWFLRDEEAPVASQKVETEQQAPIEKPVVPKVTPEPKVEKEQPATVDRHPAETDKNQTSAGTEHSKPSLARRPDPLSAPAARPGSATKGRDGAAIPVEVNANDNQYTFHYQLMNGKLMLFGPFEKDSYQVIELDSADAKHTYLAHGNKFYRLSETGNEIKPLTQVTDSAVIRKLAP